MTLSSEQMMDLMAFADGELEGADRDRMEALIASDSEAAEFVGQLATLGECVRRLEEERAPDGVATGIADAVMARVAEEPNVHDLAAERATRRVRALMAGTASLILAAAAGWLLFFRQPEEVPDWGQAETATQAEPSVAGKGWNPLSKAGVELEALESASHQVSVFYVPSPADADASSVVVWIDEDSPREEPDDR